MRTYMHEKVYLLIPWELRLVLNDIYLTFYLHYKWKMGGKKKNKGKQTLRQPKKHYISKSIEKPSSTLKDDDTLINLGEYYFRYRALQDNSSIIN